MAAAATVIELLSGTPGTPEDWTPALADVAADAWAATHQGTAPILVMPDANGHFTGDTECVDGAHGRAETYLTADVRAWMVTHFRATPGRKAWVVSGASEGGYCALDLALRHPNQFATFLDFSGLDRPTASGGALRLFRGSQRELQLHSPRYLLASRQVGAPIAGWFEVGSRDGGTTHAVQAMADLSRRAGIDTSCCSITPITRRGGGVASPMHCRDRSLGLRDQRRCPYRPRARSSAGHGRSRHSSICQLTWPAMNAMLLERDLPAEGRAPADRCRAVVAIDWRRMRRAAKRVAMRSS
jgi:hypothetical protein